MSDVIYTFNALNEFGHPVYQQTSDREMAITIFMTWRRYVICNGWSCLTCEPAIGDSDNDSDSNV